MNPLRITLTREQSDALQATGENAFSVSIRRGYVPGDRSTIGSWELILVPADHRRIIGALNVIGGSHEARRIKTRKP